MTARQLTQQMAIYAINQQRHIAREHRRIAELRKGNKAPYGYFIDKGYTPVIIESDIDDTPDLQYLRDYKLELTYEQAVSELKANTSRINMVVRVGSIYMLTPKNALKLPENTFIRDITGKWLLWRKKRFIKLI